MPIDQELVSTLTNSFNAELRQLKEIEEQRERERKAKAENTEALLKTMLEMQAAADQRAEARRKFLVRFVLGPSGLIAAISGGLLAYVQATRPTDPSAIEQSAQVEAVGAKVDRRVNELDRHIKNNDKKIERVVEVLLDQQVQISESADFIVGKIETAHPRTRNMDVPASVKAGREKARAIKAKRVTTEYDPADPIGDL